MIVPYCPTKKMNKEIIKILVEIKEKDLSSFSKSFLSQKITSGLFLNYIPVSQAQVSQEESCEEFRNQERELKEKLQRAISKFFVRDSHFQICYINESSSPLEGIDLDWDCINGIDFVFSHFFSFLSEDLHLVPYLVYIESKEKFKLEFKEKRRKLEESPLKFLCTKEEREESHKEEGSVKELFNIAPDILRLNYSSEFESRLISEELKIEKWVDRFNKVKEYCPITIPTSEIITLSESNQNNVIESYDPSSQIYTLVTHKVGMFFRLPFHYQTIMSLTQFIDEIMFQLSPLLSNEENKEKVIEILNITRLPEQRFHEVTKDDLEGSSCNINNDQTRGFFHLTTICLFLKDVHLLNSILSSVSVKVLNPTVVDRLLRMSQVFGKSWCIDLILRWSGTSQPLYDIKTLIEKIQIFGMNVSTFVLKNHIEALNDYIFSQEFQNQKSERNKNIYHETNLKSTQRIQMIKQTMIACCLVNAKEPLLQLIDHIISKPEVYQIEEVIDLVFNLKYILDKQELFVQEMHFNTLIKFCYYALSSIQTDVNGVLETWEVKSTIDCRCRDCETINNFLRSIDLIHIKLTINEERRKHVVNKILEGNIPLNMDVDKGKKPYSLLIEKLEEEIKEKRKNMTEDYERIIEIVKPSQPVTRRASLAIPLNVKDDTRTPAKRTRDLKSFSSTPSTKLSVS